MSNQNPIIFTPLEHRVAQGVHVHQSITEDYPAIKILGVLNGLPPRAIKKIAGNGIHFHMIAAWVVFVLSNVRRIGPGEGSESGESSAVPDPQAPLASTEPDDDERESCHSTSPESSPE